MTTTNIGLNKYHRMRKVQEVEKKVGMDIKTFLEQEYVLGRRSTHDIGKQVGVRGITIHRWLKKFNIESRSVQESIRTRHNLDLIDDVLTDEEEQVIRGSLMGDGGLYTRNGKTASFQEGHGLGQEQYLKWKEQKLRRLQPRLTYPVSKKTSKKECYLATSFFHSLERLRKDYYTDGKRVTLEVLQKLTPLGLAIWYMDDAHKLRGGGIRLYTCSFNLEEHELIIEHFKDFWNILPKMEWSGDNPYLKFVANEAEKLIDVIEPHIVASMSYKISNRGRYEPKNVSIFV